MEKKSITDILNKLEGVENPEDGFAELTPEEAEELAGGHTLNGACGSGNNRGCPVSNTGCGPREAAEIQQ